MSKSQDKRIAIQKRTKIFYADGVDWQHHGSFTLYASPEAIKQDWKIRSVWWLNPNAPGRRKRE